MSVSHAAGMVAQASKAAQSPRFDFATLTRTQTNKESKEWDNLTVEPHNFHTQDEQWHERERVQNL